MEGTNTYHYLLVVQTNSGTRGKPIVVYELTTIGYCYEPIVVHASTNTGRPADLYRSLLPPHGGGGSAYSEDGEEGRKARASEQLSKTC